MGTAITRHSDETKQRSHLTPCVQGSCLFLIQLFSHSLLPLQLQQQQLGRKRTSLLLHADATSSGTGSSLVSFGSMGGSSGGGDSATGPFPQRVASTPPATNRPPPVALEHPNSPPSKNPVSRLQHVGRSVSLIASAGSLPASPPSFHIRPASVESHGSSAASGMTKLSITFRDKLMPFHIAESPASSSRKRPTIHDLRAKK